MTADGVLCGVGAALLLVVTALVVLLALLPGGPAFLKATVSSAAYGSHRAVVFAVLTLFGSATAALAAALGLRLQGTAGWTCGVLVGVWAAAAVFDAFVRTESHLHSGTAFGQVHTLVAVAGIVAQVLAAFTYLGVVRRRAGRIPASLGAVTAIVLAGVLFVAVHPDSLAGLSERLLFAASALWMLASVRLAPPLVGSSGR